MEKAEIDNDFVFELLKQGLIFEHKPMRFKRLTSDDKYADNEVLILQS